MNIQFTTEEMKAFLEKLGYTFRIVIVQARYWHQEDSSYLEVYKENSKIFASPLKQTFENELKIKLLFL